MSDNNNSNTYAHLLALDSMLHGIFLSLWLPFFANFARNIPKYRLLLYALFIYIWMLKEKIRFSLEKKRGTVHWQTYTTHQFIWCNNLWYLFVELRILMLYMFFFLAFLPFFSGIHSPWAFICTSSSL